MGTSLTVFVAMGACVIPVAWFAGVVCAFAAVRSAGYRLFYADHRWQVARRPAKPGAPPAARTLRSLN